MHLFVSQALQQDTVGRRHKPVSWWNPLLQQIVDTLCELAVHCYKMQHLKVDCVLMMSRGYASGINFEG